MKKTLYILKELKYATRICSTEAYVFNVLIKSLLDMSCRLLVACDEMRKRHFIDNINVKTSKTMKKTNNDVNVGVEIKILNIVHAWYTDVDLKIGNKDWRNCILVCHSMLH